MSEYIHYADIFTILEEKEKEYSNQIEKNV